MKPFFFQPSETFFMDLKDRFALFFPLPRLGLLCSRKAQNRFKNKFFPRDHRIEVKTKQFLMSHHLI